LKIPHHGSAGNLSNRLMAEIDCHRYAISSDGSRHGLPDPDSIARIVKACTSPCDILTTARRSLRFGRRSPQKANFLSRSSLGMTDISRSSCRPMTPALPMLNRPRLAAEVSC
jgi:hypothetical protein